MRKSFGNKRLVFSGLLNVRETLSFFYNIVNRIRKRPNLHKISKNDGRWYGGDKERVAETVEFFKNQFTGVSADVELTLIGRSLLLSLKKII